MAEAKVAPSSTPGVGPEASPVGATADGGSPEDEAEAEDDASAAETSPAERDDDWPGPIDEPPPLFAA